jgi:hypothetical protein
MKWKTKLNEQIEKNIGLNKRLAESVADGILDKSLKVLHRLRKRSSLHLPKVLSLKVKKNIVRKLEMLKESYFSIKPTAHLLKLKLCQKV